MTERSRYEADGRGRVYWSIRDWYDRSMERGNIVRGWLPYGAALLGLCLFVLPVVLPLAGIGGVLLYTDVLTVPPIVADALANPLVLAGIVAGVYATTLVVYRPIDKNDYGPDGNSTPTNYEEFESLMTAMGFSAFPISYFLLLRFEAETSVYLDQIGLSPFAASLGMLVIGPGLVYAWLRHRYKHKDTRVCPELATFWGGAMFYVPITVLYFAQIPLGFDLVLYGSLSDPVMATFVPSAFLLAFTARRLRWTVNEDYFGFRGVNPFVPLWGVPRVVFAFGLAAVWLGAPLSEPVVAACLAPMAGGVLYIGWRAYVSGDLKAPAHGWLSSPGRKLYEDNRKANNKQIARIARAGDAVEEFNEFAEEHGLTTLDEPSITSFDPNTLNESLDAIHDEEVRGVLEGRDYNEFSRLRKAVKAALQDK